MSTSTINLFTQNFTFLPKFYFVEQIVLVILPDYSFEVYQWVSNVFFFIYLHMVDFEYFQYLNFDISK